ncbi:MAG: beta-lactamase family protein [Bacteroidales bacterium]|nr:beta-lactamase family protein [Bacteroidales bacterium]
MVRVLKVFITSVFVLLLCCKSGHNSSNSLNSITDNICILGNFSGSVLVAFRDSIVVNRGYGFSDKDKTVVNGKKTIYPIASVTKLFVKQAILDLVYKDSISLNSKLSDYINSVMYAKDINIGDLIHHQSGLPDIHNRIARYDNPWALDYSIEPDDLIDSINSFGELDFAPGNRTAYSNSNYLILARVIEVITGKLLDVYLQETIFTTFGMVNTGLYGDHSHIKGHARGFSTIRGNVTYTPDFNFNNFRGSGNAYSTTTDMFSYYSGCKDFLPKDISEQITQHSGLYTGYRSYYKAVPEIGLVIIILSNNSDFTHERLTESITEQVKEILLRENCDIAKDCYSGNYTATVNGRILSADITFNSCRYLYSGNELIYIDNNTFLMTNSGFTKITFNITNNGDNVMTVNDNGIIIRFSKTGN